MHKLDENASLDDITAPARMSAIGGKRPIGAKLHYGVAALGKWARLHAWRMKMVLMRRVACKDQAIEFRLVLGHRNDLCGLALRALWGKNRFSRRWTKRRRVSLRFFIAGNRGQGDQ
jgi:hypothetical protein